MGKIGKGLVLNLIIVILILMGIGSIFLSLEQNFDYISRYVVQQHLRIPLSAGVSTGSSRSDRGDEEKSYVDWLSQLNINRSRLIYSLPLVLYDDDKNSSIRHIYFPDLYKYKTIPIRFPDLYERLFSIKKDYPVYKKMRVVIIGLGRTKLPTIPSRDFCPQFIEILAILSDRKVEFTLIDSSRSILELAENPHEYSFYYDRRDVGDNFEQTEIFHKMRKALAGIMKDVEIGKFYKRFDNIFRVDSEKLRNISIHTYNRCLEDIDYGENLVDIIISTNTLCYSAGHLDGEQRVDLLIGIVRALKPLGRFLLTQQDFYPYLLNFPIEQRNNIEEVRQVLNRKIPDFNVEIHREGKIIEIQKIPSVLKDIQCRKAEVVSDL